MEKEKWFSEVGEEARPTRMNTMITDEGAVRKEMVLNLERARLDVRKNFYTVRAVKNWNDLPEAVRSQTSINGFKNSYDKWWNTQSLSDEKTSSVTRSMGNDE